MKEENITLEPAEEVSTDEMILVKEHPLEAGEKVFAIVLLITGLTAFAMALELWGRMKEPKIASAAAVPVFVSGLWSLMALLTVIENVKQSTPLSAKKNPAEKIRAAIGYALPANVLVVIGMILVYCGLLVQGISFYIATPLFLYGSMCYLTRKDYVKNILWTAIVMAFIILVFRMLFSVVFP
ncbi:MAG: tripartite tricarboxylate transporter TctB family protein [Bacillota bacterium]|nr:tripartite tricarboxylate transporter TctB family protein [Bacillota bacterium]